MSRETSGIGEGRGFVSRYAVEIAAAGFMSLAALFGIPRDHDADAMYYPYENVGQPHPGKADERDRDFLEESQKGTWKENEPPPFDPSKAASAPDLVPEPTMINPRTGFSSEDLGSGPEPYRSAATVPDEPGFVSIVNEVAGDFNLDPELVLAMIGKESWGDHDAESITGNVGYMQLNQVSSAETRELFSGKGKRFNDSRKEIGEYALEKYAHIFGGGPEEVWERVRESPYANIVTGMALLKHYEVHEDGDMEEALKCYFAGPNGKGKHEKECNDYVERVESIRSYLEMGDSFDAALKKYSDAVREGSLMLSANK